MYNKKNLLIFCLFFLAIEKAQKRLHTYYTAKQFIQPEHDWPPYHFKYFTPLAIIYDNMYNKLSAATNTATLPEDCNKTTEDINSLFSTYRGCGSYKILIEGEPGIGKTILSSEIAVQWADKILLDDKALLFLLFMRQPETKSISNVKSLVEHFFYDDIPLVNEITEWLINSNGKHLTIILDGYDEASRYSAFFDFVNELIAHRTLPECGLVITSRPAESSYLHDRVNCRAEVLGFTEQTRQQFINLYIEKQEKEKQIYQTNKQDIIKQNIAKKTEIIQKLLKNSPIINTLCYIPLNITMLLLCLTESEEEIDLPTTTTTLYEKFIIITIKRFLHRQPGFTAPVTGFQDLPQEYYQTFLQLSKFAYSVSDSMQLVFELTEIEKNCQNFITHGNGLGLLKPACFLNTGVQSAYVSYNFLHKSIQEYMAAYHISLPSGTLATLLNKRFWDSSYFNIWIMYVGITGGEQRDFKQFLSSSRFKWFALNPSKIANKILNDKIKCLHLLRCASEAKESKFLLSIQNIFEGKMIDLSSKSLSETDIKTLAVLLLDLPGGPWTLNLSRCNINNKRCKLLFETFSSQTVTANIEAVNISFNSIYSENLYRLCQEIFKLWRTKEVILSIDALLNSTTIKKTEQFMNSLEHLIQTDRDSLGKLMILYQANKTRLIVAYSDLKYLKCFQLYDCELNEDTAKRLKQSITEELKGHTVGHIYFSYSIYDHHDVETLSYLMENFKKIKFCGRNMHSKGAYLFHTDQNNDFQVDNNSSTCLVDFLAAVIQNDSQKNAISSYFTILPEDAKEEIRKILRDISALKVLDLVNNCMSDYLADDIALILSCGKLEELYLGGNNLQEAGIIKIAEALQNNDILKVIDISKNKINSMTNKSIAALVANKTSLERLYLNGNGLQDEDFNIITSALQCTSLKILNVSQNAINGTVTIRHRIVHILQRNLHLVELCMSHIGGCVLKQCITAISVGLQDTITLKVLDISNNNISSEAAGDITVIVSKQVNLEKLILSGNNLQDGLIVIIKELKCYPTLRMLDISNNNASITVTDKIAAVLCFQTRLKKLYLGGSNLMNTETLQTLQYFLAQTVFDTLLVINLSDEAGDSLSSVSSIHIVCMQALLLAYSVVNEHDEFNSPLDDYKQSRIPTLTAELSLKHSLEMILRDGSKCIAVTSI